MKLTRGAICNAGVSFDAEHLDARTTAILKDVASQELFLQMTESLFSELIYCVKHDLIDHSQLMERNLCEAAQELLFDSTDRKLVSFDELQFELSQMHKRLANFIRRRFIYEETVPVPVATFDLEQLKRVVVLVRSHTLALKESMFVVLLDEYENLFPYQKRIINSLLKLGPPNMSVKIAKKLASQDVAGTTTGQELQEIHDYTRIQLVYNIEDRSQQNAYHQLLRHIIENMTKLEGCHSINADNLLPQFSDSEVDETLWLAEVIKLSKITLEEFKNLPIEKQREKRRYYGEAATYRVLLGKGGRHAEKRFAGFQRACAPKFWSYPLLPRIFERGLPSYVRR